MPSWEWLGQRFILSRHKRDLDSSLDEYLPEGETPETWQQLVAVQQLTKAGEREVLGALKGSGIITEVLGKGARGCLLRVHLFPGEAQTQEGLLLLRSAEDAESKGGGLLVISYLSKPALVARELLDLRLERWTARLLAQLSMSKAVSRTGETPAPQTSPPESP